ncbi:MAG: TIM barrel protein [Phycisphaeraceae bacterium]|nr:TIM barrel protein [Phycisphaeraceae bacterium]
MPQISAFPKAYLDDLCVTGDMSLDQWIELATKLEIPGLEMYSGLLDLQDPKNWPRYRRMTEDLGMCVPMLCCSPDFTHPDPGYRQQQVDLQKRNIEMSAALGSGFCRVLSGQRRPEVNRADGLRYAAESIIACHDHALSCNVVLNLENHYKDNHWQYPEFAQHMDVFCDLLAMIDEAKLSNFGVNYDPSNTLLAGEDPLEMLRRVKHRVVTMHASDRYLTRGTIEDLRKEEDSIGYASRLSHGEIGKGLNDYDAIFTELVSVGFDSWISIEDGVDGFDQLQRSVTFLKRKISEHWPS